MRTDNDGGGPVTETADHHQTRSPHPHDQAADAAQSNGDGRQVASTGGLKAEIKEARIDRHHLDMLAASGITAEHAATRGYETITDKHRLADLKITAAGRNVPGLLVPTLRDDGSAWGCQYRPDVPRLRGGKTVKYETPTGQRNGLDIPPGVADRLGNPDVPLFITEGVKKADCGALHGLCIVALSGVWNWLHTNSAGGKMALPDWRDGTLNNGRRVIIAFDGDLARKEPVQKAASALAGYLATKGAHVEYLWLPDTDDKTGLDDYLAGHTVAELWRLVKRHQPPVTKPKAPGITPSNNSATPQHPCSTEVPSVALLPRILDAVAEEVRSRGLVGEERLAKTLYLVLTSRLLKQQVSAGVKGHSASGKSYTVETVTRFFPPEAYLEFTAMSERALVYSTEEYAHRTLIVYEVTALREGVEDDMTSYFVRSLLSEGRIVYPVTVRDGDGGFVTRTIIKEGPTNLVFTTTKTRVHAENETRILSLSTDDSREQTARVLLELADESSASPDLEEWRDLQRWLADAEHRVTIPYARHLAQQVAPLAVRLRRDFGSLLALIPAHAVLHQASRARDAAGRIVATLDDYAVVRELVADTIAEGVGATVSDTVRETVAAVAALATEEGVALRDIAAKLELDKSNVSRRVNMAADGGYLRNLEDKRGKPSRWVIGDPLPGSDDLLPSPAQLATPDTTVDQECCGVALESEEKNADLADPWGRYIPRTRSDTSVTTSHGAEKPGPTSEDGCDGCVSDDVTFCETWSDQPGQAFCDAVTDVSDSVPETRRCSSAAAPALCECGKPLTAPTSIARGCCAECHLIHRNVTAGHDR